MCSSFNGSAFVMRSNLSFIKILSFSVIPEKIKRDYCLSTFANGSINRLKAKRPFIEQQVAKYHNEDFQIIFSHTL